MDQQEIPLAGGNLSTVVRASDTVRRPLRPWSAAVHRLLRGLEARGFEGAPRFLGIDDGGREILSFMEGEVGAYPAPYMWSDEALVEVMRLLRQLHNAAIGYVAPAEATWQFIYPDPPHEMICHNDVAPYNAVFVEGRPRALIDFDTAGPGPRIGTSPTPPTPSCHSRASCRFPTATSCRMSHRTMPGSDTDVYGC